MKNIPLWFPLSLAILYTLYGSALFPELKLITFAPMLAIVYQRKPYLLALWISLFCGLIVDTVSSQYSFGLYGACYLLTTMLCYHQKKHFFEEKPSAISFFSGLISSVFSFVLIVATYIFQKPVAVSFELTVSDCIISPIFDALYALIWFTVPMKGYSFIMSGKWKKILKKQEELEDV